MSNYLQDHPRILILISALIIVSGGVGYLLLPRMEDPRLTPRVARITTVLPGADAERVEALVTEKLENAIREVEEVKEIRSSSSSSLSFVAVELHDDVDEVEAENVWSRIRDKAEEAHLEMPSETLASDLKKFDITASAAILALRWDLPSPPNYAILNRFLKQLRDRVDGIRGTEKTEFFGDAKEEILVTLDSDAMSAMRLTPIDISQAIAASDSKVSAGLIRSKQDNYLLEVAGEIDTLERLGNTPIQLGAAGNFVELADVATIEKTIQKPQATKILLDEQTAVALGAQVQPRTRIDLWTADLENALHEFDSQLPNGVSLVRVFVQDEYVSSRMSSLLLNLFYGTCAIFAVILVMMGWRAAIVVGLTLPLVSLSVLACMQWLGVPMHQMSITGLIIALGLMIDNAIVVVDEVSQSLQAGDDAKTATKKNDLILVRTARGIHAHNRLVV